MEVPDRMRRGINPENTDGWDGHCSYVASIGPLCADGRKKQEGDHVGSPLQLTREEAQPGAAVPHYEIGRVATRPYESNDAMPFMWHGLPGHEFLIHGQDARATSLPVELECLEGVFAAVD
jgi:hypothetical protein